MDLERLFDVEFVAGHPGATLVYHDPLTQTRVFRVRDGELDAAVKHTRYSGLRRRFRWLRHGTPAQNEFESARALADAGIPTAEPLGYRCRRTVGLPRDSVLIVRWIADAPSIYRQAGGRGLRQAAADFAVRLFAAGVYPGDLNPGNVLARRAGDGGFELFLIDQVEVVRGEPLDRARMARCLARFHLRASCADSWGPWASLKWLAATIGRLDLPLAERHRLWRQTIRAARARQGRLRGRYVQQADDEPPLPGRPRVRKEVMTPDQLARVVAEWRRGGGQPAGQWRTVTCDGRDWLVLATDDPAAAKAAWLRLLVLWNLLVVAPRPGAWLIERDGSMVVAQPVVGQPVPSAMAQASEPIRRQVRWQLAKLIVRLRQAGAAISADHAGRLVALGEAGRVTAVGFDRDVPIEFDWQVHLDEWADRFAELRWRQAETFRWQIASDLRRAIRLSRWAMV